MVKWDDIFSSVNAKRFRDAVLGFLFFYGLWVGFWDWRFLHQQRIGWETRQAAEMLIKAAQQQQTKPAEPKTEEPK